jgi:hypothetical protein
MTGFGGRTHVIASWPLRGLSFEVIDGEKAQDAA